MRVLITGAAGFVGRHLIERLVREHGISVCCVDLRQPRTVVDKCAWICCDLSVAGWTNALRGEFDAVVHLAQSLRYRDFPEGSADMVRINIDATLELLEWSRKRHVKRFVLASTGNVYRQANRLLKESDPCEPTSMYAASKLSAEHIARQYHSLFPITVLRLFGVYGPGQRGMTIPSMIERVRTGSEVTLGKGKGLCISPLYVSDCAEILFKLLKHRPSNGYEVYNVAGKEVLDLAVIAAIIGKHLQKEPNTRITSDNPTYLKGNARKLYDAIDYQPHVSFAEGLALTLAAKGEE